MGIHVIWPGYRSSPAAGGGVRVADAAYHNIPYLEDTFRVLTPTYPALETMAGLADGIAGILEAERIEHVSVLAGSFGGMLAQVFVRRHPQLVHRLILSTTAVLDTGAVERYKQALEALEPMPDEQVRQMAEQTMIQIIAPPEDRYAFYQAFLHELYTCRVSKAELLSTYHCLIDFAENYMLTADDLQNWPGQILILESDDDATFDERVRALVRGIYPQAQNHVFHNAGHSPAATQPDEYFRVVKGFLNA